MTENTDIKAAAKRLSAHLQREHGLQLQHGQALNAIAASIGEHNWHVLCGRLGADPKPAADPITPRYCINPHELRERFGRQPFSMFIVAKAGSGKTWQVAELVLDEFQEGRQIIILDNGRTYRHMARLLGGTEVVVLPNGEHKVTRMGNANFVLFEFEECRNTINLALDLPGISGIPFDLANALVVVDESHYVLSAFSGCVDLVASYAKQGASVCVSGQSDSDVAPFKQALPNRQVWMRLGPQ